MRISMRFGLAALAAATFLGTAQDAKAVYAPELVSVAAEGGFYRWTYQAVLGVGSGTGITLQSGNGTISPGTPGSSDFFTIYDIQGYQAGSAVAGGSHALITPVVNVGVNGPLTAPPDNPNLVNLSFQFVGGTVSGLTTFTGFSFLSTVPPSVLNTNGIYTSQYTNSTETKIGEIGLLELPGAVPEPSSVALVGMGLAGLFGYGYRRRRQG